MRYPIVRSNSKLSFVSQAYMLQCWPGAGQISDRTAVWQVLELTHLRQCDRNDVRGLHVMYIALTFLDNVTCECRSEYYVQFS